MNKITIPTILMATVMVAGMFAFMPVEQASTVHTTVQGSQSQVQAAEDLTDRTAVTTNDVATATISTNNNSPFLITSMIVCSTSGADDDEGGDTNEVIVDAITIDGDVIEVDGAALAIGVLLADGEVDSSCVDALVALAGTNGGEFGGVIASDGGNVVVTFNLEGDADDVINSVKVVGIADGSSTLSVVTALP